jgi:hypothetical protein
MPSLRYGPVMDTTERVDGRCPHRTCGFVGFGIRRESHLALTHDAWVPSHGPVTDGGTCTDALCRCGGRS